MSQTASAALKHLITSNVWSNKNTRTWLQVGFKDCKDISSGAYFADPNAHKIAAALKRIGSDIIPYISREAEHIITLAELTERFEYLPEWRYVGVVNLPLNLPEKSYFCLSAECGSEGFHVEIGFASTPELLVEHLMDNEDRHMITDTYLIFLTAKVSALKSNRIPI